MLTKSQQWLLENADLLSQIFGSDRIVIDGSSWQYLLIYDYPLPSNWQQQNSRLLICFPDISKIFNFPPDHFYLDLGLRIVIGKTPKHYFEKGGFNDLRKQGFARFSFHIEKGWRPTLPCRQGTTLVDVLDMLHKAMYQAAEEG